MDFTVSEAAEELAGLVRKIVAEREAPWADLAAAGVLAAGLPASLDGAGLGFLEQCSVLMPVVGPDGVLCSWSCRPTMGCGWSRSP